MPFLVVEEKSATRHVPIFGREVRVGRAPDNDVMLSDDKASRYHCILSVDARGRFSVRDLGSRNGTYFQGQRILEQVLQVGELFQIGNAKIKLMSEESSAFETQNAAEAITQASLPTVVPEAVGINEALAALAKATVEDTPKRLMESAAEFVGRLLPGLRVCIAVAEGPNSSLKTRAFFNFISGTPEDELPPTFRRTADKLLAPRAKTVTKPLTSEGPPCVYVPLACGDCACGVLYVERATRDALMTEPQVRLVENAALLVALLLGSAKRGEEVQKLKDRLEFFEGELGRVRGELEARLDLQTAELTAMRAEAEHKSTPAHRYDYSGIVASGPAMQEVFRLLDKVTDLPVPVLIQGESGTGKELVARALHFNSSRARRGRFVAENCAAMPETLLESELFGYVKGAFTGAERDKVGLFGMADGGTIFLDEIGEVSPSMQAKLLRVLEEGEIRPIGAKAVRKVDFRLVCATNRDLAEEVRKGNFRQDLFFRINVVTIRLPALRERKEDIPLLVDVFLKQAVKEAGLGAVKMDRGVLKAMMNYSWPGNVRELENEVKKMVALCDGRKIDLSVLSLNLRQVAEEESLAESGGTLKDMVENIEKRKILEALERTKGNKSRAAELLGLSRLGLRKKMERYELE